MARILYLAQHLTFDNIRISGNQLIDALRGQHELQVVGMVAPAGSRAFESPVADFVLPEAELADFDAMVLEGGWMASRDRLSLAAATAFVRAGGQLLVLDLNKNEAREEADRLASAADLFGARLQYDDAAPQYLHDDLAFDPKQRACWFYPQEMGVSDWLQPAFADVDRLLVQQPLRLWARHSIAATGTRTTDVLADDIIRHRGLVTPWASVNAFGRGHVAVMAAILSADRLVAASPGNATWVLGLLHVMLEKSIREFGPTQKLPPRGLDAVTVLDLTESQSLERKSSFLAPTDPTRPRTKKEMQFEVGRAIAALANTDGGHVVIGQADNGDLLGLAGDFRLLAGKASKRDLFEQSLNNYVRNNLAPWSVTQLSSTWVERDGKELLVLFVPAASEPVHVKQGQDEHIFTRSLATTAELKGRELTAWLHGTRWRN